MNGSVEPGGDSRGVGGSGGTPGGFGRAESGLRRAAVPGAALADVGLGRAAAGFERAVVVFERAAPDFERFVPDFARAADGFERAADVFARADLAPAFARAVFARVAGEAFDVEVLVAVVPPSPLVLDPAPRRLSLRTPGRDRGRLPSTPGSVFAVATREK